MGNIKCDGKCEVCKYDECILTDEEIDAMADESDISASLSNYYQSRNVYLERMRRYHKEVYYPKNKEKIKAYVTEWRKQNKEKVREYQRQHKRDRKEYQRQYYLKMKERRNANKEITCDSNIDCVNINNCSTAGTT